jgi:hypothetical protein
LSWACRAGPEFTYIFEMDELIARLDRRSRRRIDFFTKRPKIKKE